MQEIGAEGRTLREAVDSACALLGVGRSELQYRLDVSHFRDSFGKPRGVDSVRIVAWTQGGGGRREKEREAPPVAATPPQAPTPAAVPAPRPEVQGDAVAVVEEFIKRSLALAGVQASIQLERREDRIFVGVSGVDGDQGAAVEAALQLANRLYVCESEKLQVVAGLPEEREVEPDQAERDLQLRAVASKVIEKVLAEKRSVTLKPMNAYERRIIHMVVAESQGVQSVSVGEGATKRVQIRPSSEGAES